MTKKLDYEIVVMQRIAQDMATLSVQARQRVWHYLDSRLSSLPVIAAVGGTASPNPSLFEDPPEANMPEDFGAGARARSNGDE